MERQGRTMRGRVLAAAAVTAAMALSVLPAQAAVPPPATNVLIDDGGDGFINASEAGSVTVTGDYDDTYLPAITSVSARIVASGVCASPPVALPDSTPVQTVGVAGGSFSLVFDVSGLTETELCVRGFLTNADGNSTTFFSTNRPTLDTTDPGAPSITFPAHGSLQKVTIRPTGKRVVEVQGTAPAGTVSVELHEAVLGDIGSAVPDASGLWKLDVVFSSRSTLQSDSGTYTIWAEGFDAAGNVGFNPDADPVVFSLDANAPIARVTVPGGEAIVFPGQPLILEGIAQDTNGQAFGGVLAVEINIHDTTHIEETILPPNTGRGNILGVVQLGEIVHQENATCTPACPVAGVTQVSWSYDASFLGPGIYTFQVETFDKAGNTPDQPEMIRVVVLG